MFLAPCTICSLILNFFNMLSILKWLFTAILNTATEYKWQLEGGSFASYLCFLDFEKLNKFMLAKKISI